MNIQQSIENKRKKITNLQKEIKEIQEKCNHSWKDCDWSNNGISYSYMIKPQTCTTCGQYKEGKSNGLSYSSTFPFMK